MTSRATIALTPLLLLLLSGASAAKTFHVAAGGNDAAAGTSPSAAWASLAKVNGAALVAGDQVLFNRGDSWSGTVKAKAGVTYGVYGTGARPVIDGSQALTGWTKSGTIWSASVGNEIKQVFVDGKFMPVARHPNQGTTFKTTADSPTDSGVLVDSKLSLSKTQILGATVTFQNVNWSGGLSVVTDLQGDTVTLVKSDNYFTKLFDKNSPYFFSNKAWMLDAPDEWIYQSGKVSLRLKNDADPATHVVRGSFVPHCFEVLGDQVTIQGFECRYTYDTGVLAKAKGVKLVDNDIHHIGTGIFEENHDGGRCIKMGSNAEAFQVLNNTLASCSRVGFQVWGHKSGVISGNTVERVGMDWLEMNGFISTHAIGIHAPSGKASTVSGNKLTDIAGMGISVSSGIIGGQVKENVVVNACAGATDCGYIYFGDSHDPNFTVDHNVLVETQARSAADVNGLYCDNTCSDSKMLDNTIVGVPQAIKIHKGASNQVHDNTIYGARWGLDLFESAVNGGQAGDVHDNDIKSNRIVLLAAGARAIDARNAQQFASIINFGTSNQNVFSSVDKDIVFLGKVGVMDLAQWQAYAYKQDLASKFLPLKAASDVQLLYNPDAAAKSFSASGYAKGKNWLDSDGKTIAWPVSLGPYESLVLWWDGTSKPPQTNDAGVVADKGAGGDKGASADKGASGDSGTSDDSSAAAKDAAAPTADAGAPSAPPGASGGCALGAHPTSTGGAGWLLGLLGCLGLLTRPACSRRGRKR